MDYLDFIESFQGKCKIYDKNFDDVDEYWIHTIYNLMIEKEYTKVLRLLEGIQNKLRRRYIMNRILRL